MIKNIINNINKQVKILKIKRYLKHHKINNYVINDDFSVDVNEDVFLNSCNLARFEVQFGLIKGNFDC